MIINDKKRILYMGVPCTREWDYYATRGGAVKCRVTFIPVRKELRHLRGHNTQQLANLALVPDVHGLMMVLGLCIDDDASRELFAALAGSNLRPDDDATCIIDYLNA